GRQVGKEVVLAVEDRPVVDFGLETQPGLHRLLDAETVDDRQHPGHAGVHEADLGVGFTAEFGRGPGKQLGIGKDLGMDFHADHDFPLAGLALDCPAHAVHHLLGLALKSAAVSTAAAAFSRVPSSNALPISCRPSGRPLSVRPPGTEMPGRPARFTVTVKTSCRYISSGSEVLAPTPKAGPGVEGVSSTSHFSKAAAKSLLIRVRS